MRAPALEPHRYRDGGGIGIALGLAPGCSSQPAAGAAGDGGAAAADASAGDVGPEATSRGNAGLEAGLDPCGSVGAAWSRCAANPLARQWISIAGMVRTEAEGDAAEADTELAAAGGRTELAAGGAGARLPTALATARPPATATRTSATLMATCEVVLEGRAAAGAREREGDGESEGGSEEGGRGGGVLRPLRSGSESTS